MTTRRLFTTNTSVWIRTKVTSRTFYACFHHILTCMS